ncbi:hypothetical protein OSJ97_25560, partial [Escherichia coli]|nr:hypothetical protein [Escherichia coli]
IIMTNLVLAFLTGLKVLELINPKKRYVESLLNINFKNVIFLLIIIIPSPIYLLVQIGMWIDFIAFLYNLFHTFAIMTLITT